MKKRFATLIILASAVAWANAALGQTARSISLPVITTELKDGPGKDKTMAFCAVCHSLDYITMQPAFSRAQWTGTVQKMIKTMGAPIPEPDSKMIIDYLSAQYGKGD